MAKKSACGSGVGAVDTGYACRDGRAIRPHAVQSGTKSGAAARRLRARRYQQTYCLACRLTTRPTRTRAESLCKLEGPLARAPVGVDVGPHNERRSNE